MTMRAQQQTLQEWYYIIGASSHKVVHITPLSQHPSRKNSTTFKWETHTYIHTQVSTGLLSITSQTTVQAFPTRYTIKPTLSRIINTLSDLLLLGRYSWAL